MWASQVVTLDADAVTVQLDLQSTMTVTGRVEFESATETPRPSPATVNVSLRPLSPYVWPIPSEVAVDQGGLFTEAVVPDRYRVTAAVIGSAANAWALKSVTTDGHDVTDRLFDIRPGETPSFVITFTDRTSDLSGSLVGPAGQPSIDTFVVVVPEDRSLWFPRSPRIASTRPDTRGHFVFQNLPPGEYRIAATTDLVPADLRDATALEALLPHSLPVTLGLGEKKTIDIRVAGR
jgi:hypothetical protein